MVVRLTRFFAGGKRPAEAGSRISLFVFFVFGQTRFQADKSQKFGLSIKWGLSMRDLAFYEADKLLIPFLSQVKFASFVQVHTEAFIQKRQKLDQLASPDASDHSHAPKLKPLQYEVEELFLVLKEAAAPYFCGSGDSVRNGEENGEIERAFLVRELLSELGADKPLLDSSDLRFLDNPIRYKLCVRAASVAVYVRVTRDSEELWPECARQVASPLRRFVKDWEAYGEFERIRWFGRIDAVMKTVIEDYQQSQTTVPTPIVMSVKDKRIERDDALLAEFEADPENLKTYGELHDWLESEASLRSWGWVEPQSIGDCLRRSWDRQGRGPWPYDRRGRKKRK